MRASIKYLIGICTAFTLSTCTNRYADFNTDPTQPTENMLQRDYYQLGTFFIQMQKNVIPAGSNGTDEVNQYQLTDNLQGDIYSGYMGVSNNWNGGQNNSTYGLIPGWYGEMFKRAYLGILAGWAQIRDRASTPETAALADIIKVAGLHRTTDTYGPLPYLNIKAGVINTKYDSQQAIYDSFFKELDNAINVLTSFSQNFPNSKILASYDLVYQGDVRKWIQFANSLKLRLAMRIVYADPAKAKLYAESAVNHPIGVIKTTDASASLKSSVTNPIRNPIAYICFQYDDIRMGANMESFLKGYKDPRISSYFNQATIGASTGYFGIRNGIRITNKSLYTPFSTIKMEENSPLPWLSAAESYFTRAEGALRGWNMGGTAKELYETGIRTSFQQAGASGTDNYLNDNTSTAAAYRDPASPSNNVTAGSPLLSTITIKWNEADSFEKKLERIITQKWIAIFPNGQEAWSEFRRTGYPKIFPVVVNNSGGTIDASKQIRRMPFPISEYQDNPQGVASGTAVLGGADNGGTRLWWDKKN
ncbi:TPA: RagB/SusD family nutrient uptake outer membrane protein [Elizabethkingia anophelis]|uniref:RagB/SusD family nutrient uptake outer membrane protein n=1 Tax=Elizabethkingia anophelis TaxID=1117645 RepID=UPI0016267A71|nr:RagB/SusD family nutrient uptake outer membrane protein [Elizabethkingia anophelis]MCT3674629.1 SusD/RagB family nutrient-binding outer membrane lipoprotein [Elizabethkingia anophelis]MCT3682113.1 SusD/RagB family nutrient-binding outer membrane lipoprotein [Elizabethkingia anophelis]MCT3704247.1 SusD/RagB family nutrient-binding outer membrane lipoprotein [Elizabethkingia anophelis]MCT3771259.1 SusD/RagB family nutrient-binding outer membrane lipoprotein [Elizabethkingia anophelis]MCT37813